MDDRLNARATPKISFAVAAYNIEAYVVECVSSILRYPGNDIEVLLVDDCSTDATGKLCDELERRDPRVRTIHHEKNSGIPTVRNSGIQAARGEWLTFVDGDDRFSDGAVEAMLNACGFDGELVVFGALSFRGEETVHYWRARPYTMTDPAELRQYCIDSMTDRFQPELYGNPNIATSWCKLFRTAFLRDNGLLFNPRVSFSQDREHLFRYVWRLTKIRFDPAQIYEYRLAIGSSLTKKWHADAVERQTAIMDGMMRTMRETHTERDRDHRWIYHYTGLFAISVRCVMQGVCHPECTWSYARRRKSLKDLRQLPWAAECLAALPEFDNEKLPWRSVLKCMRLGLYDPILMLKPVRSLKRHLRK